MKYPIVLSLVVLLLLAGSFAVIDAPFAYGTNPLYPDLRVETKHLSRYQISNVGGQKILRFDTGVANVGDGPVELRGLKVGDQMVAKQRIYLSSGSTEESDVGIFTYDDGDGHGHWHYWNFVEYELTSVDDPGIVLASNKASFCLLDVDRLSPRLSGSPLFAAYNQCNQGDANAAAIGPQGVSRGWVDVYSRWVAGQQFDVTGLPKGNYLLTARANPDHLLIECDTCYGNNEGSVVIKIR